MAKKIRFPLGMKDGIEVRSIEELRDNFSLEQVLSYLSNGKLETWLRDRYLNEIADAVSELDQEDDELGKKICNIFEVEYVDEDEVDIELLKERQRRTELLQNFTDEEKFFEFVDKIAFEQDDIYDLLDEGEVVIYLCGDSFSIPLSEKGINYIGVNNPIVVISSKDKVDFEGKGILFENVRFDEKYQKILDDLEPKINESEIKEPEINDTDFCEGYGEYVPNSFIHPMLSKRDAEGAKDCYKKLSTILNDMECAF